MAKKKRASERLAKTEADLNALLSALTQPLDKAKTPSEIIRALAAGCWAKNHGGATVPDEEIPTVADLVSTLEADTSSVDDLRPEMSEWLSDLLPMRDETGTPLQWKWDAFAATAWDTAAWDSFEWGYRLIVRTHKTPGRPTFLRSLEQVHERWVQLNPGTHPLAALVEAWQNRPRPAVRNKRPDRIFPARLGMVDPSDRRAGRLFTPALHSPDGQQTLPGFEREIIGPALPLALYDLAASKAERRGRGAPLALRIWIEAVLSVPLGARDYPSSMSVTLRDLLKALYPGRTPKPNEYMPRLEAAVNALDSPAARIPWEDPVTRRGGLRRVVSVTDIPRGPGKLDDVLTLTVHLPPGTGAGPVVSPKLAHYGTKSAAKYRALIGLAYSWFDPGRTRHPVRGGKHWLYSNDPKTYGDPLTDDERISLCFPNSTITQRRVLAFKARKILDELVADGEARLVEGRILPPRHTKRPE